jgi:hypothetical protein
VISLDDLKAWLGEPSDPGIDALLTALEARAVEIIERETGRYFRTETPLTEVMRGDGSDKLWLSERPATITSVEERSRPGDSWTAIASGYEIETETKLPTPSTLRRTGSLVWKRGYDYRVIYPFGYTAGAEPGDIRQAVIDVVDMLYHDRARKGLRSETIGDYSYTRFDIDTALSDPKTIVRWRGAVFA